MSTAEWLAAQLAAAPPLTAAQITALRPVFAPHMHAAPAMTTRAAPASTAPHDPSERTTHEQR